MKRLPAFTATRGLPGFGVVTSISKGVKGGGEGGICWLGGSFFDTCGGGLVCTPNVLRPPESTESDGICCRPGQVNCRGRCRERCPPGITRNPRTCDCDCPACPAYGQVQDEFCFCRCARLGEIPCNGICIDPMTDQRFCGGCPGATCNAYDEMCCRGVCTKLGNKLTCRDCDDKVPDGWDCCDYKPTPLGTPQNCRTCGEKCDGGRECTPLGCKCPPDRTECGVCCLPTHKACCGLKCTDIETNTSHCGRCGRKCPTGATCELGQCKCPPNQRACGGVCWPDKQLCCQDTPCPPSSTDCCPECRDLLTDTVQTPTWIAWTAAHAGEKWATCEKGVLTCHPSLPQFGRVCCPPTCTGFNTTTRQCTGCCAAGCTGRDPITGQCVGCP